MSPDGYDKMSADTVPFSFTADSAMSQMLAQNWWVLALRGVLALFFGVVALLLPGVPITALVLLFAAYMLVDGIFAVIAGARAARRQEHWGLLIFEGIVDLIAGGIALVWPLITVVAFIYLLAAWAIVSGGLVFAAAFRLQLEHGRWLLAFSGLASLVWGFLLLMWPLVGAVVLAWWMGAYALVFGVALLFLAFRLRRQRDGESPAGAMSHA
jgi:uncharacterized membrane protein HdeD (DUF308 family)